MKKVAAKKEKDDIEQNVSVMNNCFRNQLNFIIFAFEQIAQVMEMAVHSVGNVASDSTKRKEN